MNSHTTEIYIDNQKLRVFQTRFVGYGRLEVVVGVERPESAHDVPEGWFNSRDKSMYVRTNGHTYSFRKHEEK